MRVKDSAKIIRHYANSFKVGNIIIYFRENNHDFKFDFRQGHPENDQAELYMRTITNPFYAIERFETLKDAIDQYEEKFGYIGYIRTKIQEENDINPSSKL